MTDHAHDIRACQDCLMLLANGDTSGTERCETEEGEAEYLADIDARWPEDRWDLVPSSWPYDPEMVGETDDGDTIPDDGGTYEVDRWGSIYRTDWTDEDRYYGRDTEGRFTYSGCDVCGSTLGGDKYPVTAMRPADRR